MHTFEFEDGRIGTKNEVLTTLLFVPTRGSN